MNSPLGLACTASLLLLIAIAPLPVAAQSAQAPVFERRSLTDFQELLERPLFNLHRRPEQTDSEEDATSSTDEQEVRAKWRLTGVVIEPERQLALFVDLKSRDHQQLETGTVLEGNWMLDQIAGDRVVLVRGAQQIEMLLYDPSTLPAPKAAKPLKSTTPEQPAVRPKPGTEQDAAKPTTPTS